MFEVIDWSEDQASLTVWRIIARAQLSRGNSAAFRENVLTVAA
jgi:hypothetical protein